MSDFYGSIYRGQSGASGGGNTYTPRQVMLNTLGQQVMMDWRQKAILDGSGFQLRGAATISVVNTGDGTALTDAAAEMCVDAGTGLTIFPMYGYVAIETPLDAGEGAWKAVATASTVGTATTPLLLRPGAVAATATARIGETGGVTVTVELASTTLILKRFVHIQGTTSASEPYPQYVEYNPLQLVALDGIRCWYFQEALDTYFAHMDWVEYDTSVITR